MVISNVHEFHFVIDRGMKNALFNLDLFSKAESLSNIIKKILLLLIPVVKNEHKWGEQRASRYLPVCNDPDEMRDHVHVYFPEMVYRELKLLHQDLNYYSIAQLLRDLLRFFLELVSGYNNLNFNKLFKLLKRWRKKVEEDKLTPRQVVRQLWKIIRHLPGQTGLINIYSRDFSPFWILRL